MLALLASSALADPLVAVVVVDQEARDQGYALELEDLVVEDALPVDVADGEHVRIVDPDGGRHEIDVAPGEAWEVTGARGEAWMSRIGQDVRSDVLLVRGDEDAVRALAGALRADVRPGDGGLLLVRPGLLFDAPWASAPGLDRVDEVRFVRVDEARPAVRAVVAPVSATIATAPESPPVPPPTPTAEAAVAPVAAISKPEAPEDVVPTESPAEASPEDRLAVALDPGPYVGTYFCGDGNPLILAGSGFFAAPQGKGEWYVSAPGVVHLVIDGQPWGRAAIEADRHYCHAVW
jgi:hypothetical protein